MMREKGGAKGGTGASDGAVNPNCSFNSHLVSSSSVDFLGRLPLHLGDVYAFLSHLIERRKLAQLGDHLNHLVRDVIDLFFGVEAAQPETDGGVRQVFAHA